MMVNIECWGCSFVIFQEILTGIAKKPYFFVIVQEGGDPLPPLDPRIIVRGQKTVWVPHHNDVIFCGTILIVLYSDVFI